MKKTAKAIAVITVLVNALYAQDTQVNIDAQIEAIKSAKTNEKRVELMNQLKQNLMQLNEDKRSKIISELRAKMHKSSSYDTIKRGQNHQNHNMMDKSSSNKHHQEMMEQIHQNNHQMQTAQHQEMMQQHMQNKQHNQMQKMQNKQHNQMQEMQNKQHNQMQQSQEMQQNKQHQGGNNQKNQHQK